MKKIKIAHSPDTDDIFMFYALKEQKIKASQYEFDFTAEDIGLLNQTAFEGLYDITALSFHAYAYLHNTYSILSSGASMAEKDYGPLLLSSTPRTLLDLRNKKIAIPGKLTTATLLLRMMLPDFIAIEMPAQNILNAIQNGTVDAGLVIHEAQIHYQKREFHVVGRVMDVWQKEASSLPLPLGMSAIKKSLGPQMMEELSQIQKQSIAYAFAHRQEALEYARTAAPELTKDEADHYLNWYANARTLHLGNEERLAITKLYQMAYDRGLIPHPVTPVIIEGGNYE